MAGPNPTPSGVVLITHNVAGIRCGAKFAYTGGTPGVSDLNLIAGGAEAAWDTHLASLVSSTYSLEQTVVRDLANPEHPAGVSNTIVPGTRSGALINLNTYALINFGVARLYRGSKPKMWQPFGVEADRASASEWGSAFIAAVNAGWNNYAGELNGGVYGAITVGAQVYVSYFSGKTPNPNPNSRSRFIPTPRAVPAIFAIESVACRATFGNQRRRL